MRGGIHAWVEMSMWSADLIAGLFVMTLGFVVVFFSLRLPYEVDYGPGAGFLPLWLGFGLIGCAIAIVLKILYPYFKKGTQSPESAARFFKSKTLQCLKMLIIIVITFLLLPILGFSVGLALFLGTMMHLIGKHRWVFCVLTALLASIGIHYIFGCWLDIPLPKGMTGW